MTDDQLANVLARWGYVPKARLDAAEKRVKELERQVYGAPDWSYQPMHKDQWKESFWMGRPLTELSREELMDALVELPTLTFRSDGSPLAAAKEKAGDYRVGADWKDGIAFTEGYILVGKMVPKERLDVAETKLKGAEGRAQIVLGHYRDACVRSNELVTKLDAAEKRIGIIEAALRRARRRVASTREELAWAKDISLETAKQLLGSCRERDKRIVELAARLAERDADAKKARQPDNSKSGMAFAFGDGEKPRFLGLAHSETECEKAFLAAWKGLCREDPLFVYIPSIMESLGYARVTKERLSDAEVGKAIGEMRTKKGHRRVELCITNDGDGRWAATTYKIRWQTDNGFWEANGNVYSNPIDAIREYHERKD
jgi:hypothetical protein